MKEKRKRSSPPQIRIMWNLSEAASNWLKLNGRPNVTTISATVRGRKSDLSLPGAYRTGNGAVFNLTTNPWQKFDVVDVTQMLAVLRREMTLEPSRETLIVERNRMAAAVDVAMSRYREQLIKTSRLLTLNRELEEKIEEHRMVVHLIEQRHADYEKKVVAAASKLAQAARVMERARKADKAWARKNKSK